MKKLMPAFKLLSLVFLLFLSCVLFVYAVGKTELTKVAPLTPKTGFLSKPLYSVTSINKLYEVWGRKRGEIRAECLGVGVSPTVSSRGDLAFVTIGSDGKSVIAIQKRDGLKPTTIAHAMTCEGELELNWSHDGSMILFPDSKGNLTIYNVDTKETRTIKKCAKDSFMLGTFLPGDKYMRVMCNEWNEVQDEGDREFFGEKWLERHDPTIRDLDGNVIWEYENGHTSYETYSADGSIMYQVTCKERKKNGECKAGGSGYDIWKVNFITGETERLTDDDEFERSLKLWQDRYLYFTSSSGVVSMDAIYRLDLNSKEKKLLFEGTGIENYIMNFSILDSGRMFIEAGRGMSSRDPHFLLSDIEGMNLKELNLLHPARFHIASPDGVNIIAGKPASTMYSFEYLIYSLLTGKTVELEPYLIEKKNLSWSPDSKSLYFENRYHIWRYDVAD